MSCAITSDGSFHEKAPLENLCPSRDAQSLIYDTFVGEMMLLLVKHMDINKNCISFELEKSVISGSCIEMVYQVA